MGKQKDEKRQQHINESRKLIGNLRKLVEEPFEELESFKKTFHCIDDLHKCQKEYVIQFNRYANINSFVDWCKTTKSDLSKIKVVKVDETYDIGVVANVPISEGEVVMRVGRKCAITASVSRFIDKHLANGLGLAAAVHSEDVSIAIQLCYWAIRIDRCPFASYIKSLPSFEQLNNLAAITLPDICGIKQYQAVFKIINEYRKIVQQYCKVFEHFEGMDQREWQTKFTLKLWLWAVGNIMSRQNNLSPLSLSGVSRGLIPLIDFVNFGPQAAVIDFDSENDSFVVLATRNIEVDEQVTFAFGSASRKSEVLFMHHGIVLQECLLDDYPLPIAIPPQVNIDKKRFLLGNIKFQKLTEPIKSLALRIGYNPDHPVHPDLIMLSKVLAMTDEEFSSLEDTSTLRYFSHDSQSASDLTSTHILLSFIASYYNSLYSTVPIKKLWRLVHHPSKQHSAQHLCKLLLWKEMRIYQLAAIFTFCYSLLYSGSSQLQDSFVMWQTLALSSSNDQCPLTMLAVPPMFTSGDENPIEIAVDPRDVYACLSYSANIVDLQHDPSQTLSSTSQTNAATRVAEEVAAALQIANIKREATAAIMNSSVLEGVETSTSEGTKPIEDIFMKQETM